MFGVAKQKSRVKKINRRWQLLFLRKEVLMYTGRVSAEAMRVNTSSQQGKGVKVSSKAPAWVEKLLELKGMDKKTGTVTTDGEDVYFNGTLIGNRSEVE